MAASLTRLLSEHDAIERSARDVLAMLGNAEAPALAHALDGLSTMIADHVRHEDGVLYPEIERHPNAELSEAAQAFAAEFEALRGDWSGYRDAWPAARIAADRAAFAADTRDILPRMIDRIHRENDCLLPLALRRGAVTLR